jgi:RNA polymerase sigma-70 factor (ECF subfamily)
VRIPDSDDGELVERARRGDRAAFGRLVERYAGAVRRVIRGVLRDPDEADDAAQDAFLAAWRGLDRVDPRRPFAPWLLRIAVNAAVDRTRRRRVRRTEPLDDTTPGNDPLPDRAAERAFLWDRLVGALDELPPRLRAAVVLFEVEGYAHAEIAAILGVPEGTVRSDVHHARRRLRAALAEWKEREG